jgi:integrase/recombinase XerD
MMTKTLVPRRVSLSKATQTVSYLTAEEVERISQQAKRGRNGERNSLLIDLLFQSGLRISEALSITPRHLQEFEDMPCLSIMGKGKKPRRIACPQTLAYRLKSYAYEKKLDIDDRFFPIWRTTAWYLIKKITREAGIQKKVYPHLFRHSDAIYRLRANGNPKALMLHLGHNSPVMTLRYLSTLSAEDALRIEQGVEF